MHWRRVHLCTGILVRDGKLLIVGNRYANLPDVLWNLPGGRQEPPETVAAAVVREFREETSLAVTVGALAYVAESYDPATATHFTNFAFHVEGSGQAVPGAGDPHVVACAWVELDGLRERLAVPVVREPLLAYLGDPRRQYYGFGESGITIALD